MVGGAFCLCLLPSRIVYQRDQIVDKCHDACRTSLSLLMTNNDREIQRALERLAAPAVFSKQNLFGNGNSDILSANDDLQSLLSNDYDDSVGRPRLKGMHIQDLLLWCFEHERSPCSIEYSCANKVNCYHSYFARSKENGTI